MVDIAKEIVRAFDRALEEMGTANVAAYQSEDPSESHRTHLGASILGQSCARKVFYSWRWAYGTRHTGRMLRLFNRGHLEEDRVVQWLRLAGITVEQFAPVVLLWYPETNAYEVVESFVPNEPERKLDPEDVTGIKKHEKAAIKAGVNLSPQQFRVSDFGGHLGGALDGKINGLQKYGLEGKGLLEVKTHNTKSFVYVKEKGVIQAKPEHYAQMQTYMHYAKLGWALYLAVNKNDDDIYIEIVPYHPAVAQMYIARAYDIIFTAIPPPRINDDPSWWQCKLCSYKRVCHEGHPLDVNCRTCINIQPLENGSWRCNLFAGIIPPEFIPNGCPQWSSLQAGDD